MINPKEFYLNQLVWLWDKTIGLIFKIIYEEFIAPFSQRGKLYDPSLHFAFKGDNIPPIKIPTDKELAQKIEEERLIHKLTDYNIWWAFSISLIVAFAIISKIYMILWLAFIDWAAFTITGRNDDNKKSH